MLARSYFGVGFMRGLNSVVEVFAPYPCRHERSLLELMRSDWIRLGGDLRSWSGPLPSPTELEKIDRIIPGGADRLLRMAEKEQTHRIDDAKRGQYLGWSLAAGAVVTAAVVSLCHGPWR